MSLFRDLDDVRRTLRDSPFQRLFEIEPLDLDRMQGAIRFGVAFKPDYARVEGENQIHGGVVAALIDIAGDYALAVHLGHFVPTIDLRIDYMRPAAGRLEVSARVVRAGRTVGVVDAEVTGADSRLVAVGRGLFGTRSG